MRAFGILTTILVVALLAWPAGAQEQAGSLAGTVTDGDGGALPGVTIEAIGPVGRVSTTTDANGQFRLPRLASGIYTVEAGLEGFASQSQEADVSIGNVTRVVFELALASVDEVITVTSEGLAIDVSSNATTTSIARERIEMVPAGRDFSDVVALASGAQDESQAGGLSIDGSSGAENRFIIDGIDTTSPQEGTSSVPMRTDFMEEVQVKSAGYAAEFGGSTGGVINAVTKGGTQDWRFGVLAQYEDNDIGGGSERPVLVRNLDDDSPQYLRNTDDSDERIDPGAFFSGPIVRDRLFVFGSYQPGLTDNSRQTTFTDGTTNRFPQEVDVQYGLLNFNGNAGSQVLYKLGVANSDYTVDGRLPVRSGRTSLTDPEDYLRGEEGERRTISGYVDYLPTANFVASLRGGLYHTDVMDTGIQFPGLVHNFSTTSTAAGIANLPSQFQRSPGFFSDILVGGATARDEYERESVSLDGTYYVQGGGDHSLKLGYQTEEITNDVQSGYNADRILYYAGRPYRSSTGQTISGQYGYFRLLNISTLGQVASRNEAIFLQDTYQTGNWTFNVGLRAEHERIPNFGSAGPSSPIEFDYDDKTAPRLGFAWDINGDSEWKLYGSYGKYFDVMKYELPRGSFGGDKWVDYFFTWDNPDWSTNSTSGCATGSNTIFESPSCPAGGFIEALDRRFNSAEDLDSTVDPNLKPMEEDEYQLGLEHQLTPRVVLGARYIYKDLVRTIEDVGIVVPGIGEVFYIANPGEGISLSLNDPSIPAFPKATREYNGLEFKFTRRMADNWALWASYTYSELEGNYSGLASSDEDGRTSPNVNRFFDHIENTYDRNGQLVFGPLGTDRPHVAKAQFVYRFPVGVTAALNQFYSSGIPVSEEAFVGSNVPFFPNGRDNLSRTDDVTQTDLSLFYDLDLSATKLRFGVTVLNLFDQEAVTRRVNERTVGSLPLTSEEFFAGGWDYEGILAANPSIVNTLFNQPNQWQPARTVRFSVRVEF